MKKLNRRRRWGLAGILFLAALSGVQAHAFLDDSVPKTGGTVTNPPAEVQIGFTEHLKPHGSRIQVRDATGHEVDKKDFRRFHWMASNCVCKSDKSTLKQA